jgi:maleate isomerase
MKFDTTTPRRIGMLTPSLNTCLEPITCAITSSVPEVSVHFSRFKAAGAGLDAASLSHFALPHLLQAAELLADAQVDLIVWNGSSGSWMPEGGEADRRLCEALERSLNIPATTMTFAVWDAFRAMGVKRYSLVAPFNEEMTNNIITNYEKEGFTCVRSVRLDVVPGQKDRVPREEMQRLIESAADVGADAIAVICTNFRGAPLVDEMERGLDMPIIDSVSATAWQSLEMLGLTPRIEGWGRLLRREFSSAVVDPAASRT